MKTVENLFYDVVKAVLVAIAVAILLLAYFWVSAQPIDTGWTHINTCLMSVDGTHPAGCPTPTPTPPWWQFWGH